MNRLAGAVRRFFVQSSAVHVRQETATSTRDLVALIDRFLDGPMRYPLEWDDFISWKSSNPHVEEVRLRIGNLEPMLFSKNNHERALYATMLVTERNQLARLLGIPDRQDILSERTPI